MNASPGASAPSPFGPTLAATYDRTIARHPDRIAVRRAGEDLTYRDLGRWADALAAQLAEAGIGFDDVVALAIGNRAEHLVGDVAIARLGAVKLPINPSLPAATVRHLLDHGEVAAVVLGPVSVDTVRDALAGADRTPQVVHTADVDPTGIAGARPLVALEDAPQAPRAAVDLPSDARASLHYTGGTTGLPKGVTHTQAAMVNLHVAQIIEAELAPEERMLLATPLAHAAGVFAQSAMIRGATVVLVDTFEADSFLDTLAAEEISWTFLVPTMIYRLLDALERRRLDAGWDTAERFERLRTVIYGAAPIAPSRLEQALGAFGPVFVQLYGQTECPNWGTRLAKSDHDLRRPELLSSCGRPSLFAELKIVDEDGEAVPAGETGEICLRSSYLLRDYHRDPAATAEKFLGDWIRTGDIGLQDAEGYVHLKDRSADIIISGGMNVSGREVEDVLARHPQVSQVAVIGVPHEDWGEAVHAVVVGADELDLDQLLAWARPQLAGYARPKSAEQVESIPETALGKIDKKALRSRHWGDRDRSIH